MVNLIQPIHAQQIVNPIINNSQSIATNPNGYINSVIQSIIVIFLTVGVIYFVWHLVMSAYHMISSNGDPKKYEEAQKSLLYACVGIIVVFSIFAILRFIGTVFNIDSLKGTNELFLNLPAL
jgi:hypothetical protein